MKFRELYESLCEVSGQDYRKIKKNDRIVMTDKDSISLPNIPHSKQPLDIKPRGMWYGIGTDWIDWVRGNMPHWETDNIFKIDVNMNKIKVLKNEKDVIEFQAKYGVDKFGFGDYKIDWSKVAQDYSGIEVNPYDYGIRMKYMWYGTFDIASGCIWNSRGLKKAQSL
jgi:hypothetical protein